MRHQDTISTLIHADSLSASVAVLSKHAVEAAEAVGSALPHDVPLAPEEVITLEAGEVLHVPRPALGLCALV